MQKDIDDLKEQNNQLANKVTPGYEVKDAGVECHEYDFNNFCLLNPENFSLLHKDNIIPLDENNDPAELSGKDIKNNKSQRKNNCY